MFLKQKLNLLSYKFEYFFRIMECACQDEDGNVQEHALWALRLYFFQINPVIIELFP